MVEVADYKAEVITLGVAAICCLLLKKREDGCEGVKDNEVELQMLCLNFSFSLKGNGCFSCWRGDTGEEARKSLNYEVNGSKVEAFREEGERKKRQKTSNDDEYRLGYCAFCQLRLCTECSECLEWGCKQQGCTTSFMWIPRKLFKLCAVKKNFLKTCFSSVKEEEFFFLMVHISTIN